MASLQTMILSPKTRELAQRLLAYEATLGTNSEPTNSVAFRVCEKFRWSLGALAGVAGFLSLISRALTLARVEIPSLSAVQVAQDGSLQGLSELESREEKGNVGSAGACLIAQLLGLLFVFVGETLTLRLIQDGWPDAAFDDLDGSGKETIA